MDQPPKSGSKKVLAALVAAVVIIAVLVPVVYLTMMAPKKPVNHAPVANFVTGGPRVLHNIDVIFDGSSSTDKDKDDRNLLSYTWAFGDGDTGLGAIITHKYKKDGNYTAILTVSDGEKSSSMNKTIEVYNGAPNITAMDPASATLSMNEGTYLKFGVTASDPNGDVLTYRWSVDGKRIDTYEDTMTFSANFFSAGVRVIRAVASDGNLNDSKEWALTVVNVDRAPTIKSYDPSGILTLLEGNTRAMTATAMDPDGDALNSTWLVDKKLMSSGTGNDAYFNYTLDYDSSGIRIVQLTFSDGVLSVSRNWTVTVLDVNRPPIIKSFSPASKTSMKENSVREFIVNATDPDGNPVIYSWTLDGTPVGGNNKTYTYVTDYSSNGTHVMIVTVFDGELSAQQRWNVTVENLNRAPKAVARVDVKVEFIGYVFGFDGLNSYDPDNDPLNYTWDFGDATTDKGKFITHVYAKEGNYTVKLTVEDTWGGNGTDILNLTVLKPIPKLTQLAKIGPFFDDFTVATVADVDGDGHQELVAGMNLGFIGDMANGVIYIFDLMTHTQKWRSANIGIPKGLAAANLDADPQLEIVVGTFTCRTQVHQDTNFSGNVLIIDGSTHTTERTGQNIGGVTSLFLADINGDMKLDILAGYEYNSSVNLSTFYEYYNGGVIAYNADLTTIYNTTDWGATLIVAAQNMDADPGIEMITFGMKAGDLIGNDNDVNLSAFEWSGNMPVEKGTFAGPNAFVPDVFTVGDLEKDGVKEFLVAQTIYVGDGNYSGNITVFSQELKPKKVISGLSNVLAVKVADVNPKVGNEIIVGIIDNDTGIGYQGEFHVLDKDGAELWRSDTIGAVYLVETGDMNGDSIPEIIVASAKEVDYYLNTTVLVYSTTTHKAIFQATGMHYMYANLFFIVDLDANGAMDLVFIDYDDDYGEWTIYEFKVS